MIRNKLIQLSLVSISVVPVVTAVSCSNEKEIQAKMDAISKKIVQDDLLGPELTAFDTKISYSSWKQLSQKNTAELSTEGWYWYFGTTKTIEGLNDNDVRVSLAVINNGDLNQNPLQQDVVVAVVGQTTSEKNRYIINRLRYKANQPSFENALIAANTEIDTYFEHLLDIFEPTVSGSGYWLQSTKTFSDFPDDFSKGLNSWLDLIAYNLLMRKLLGKDVADQLYRIGEHRYWTTSWEKNANSQNGVIKFAFNIEPAEFREIAITVYPKVE